LAYAGLASTYAVLREYTTLPPSELVPKAKAAVAKALEFDSDLAEAYSVLAMIKGQFEGDFKGAEQSFKRAIELSPNYSTAHHWYSIFLRTRGRFEEAMVEIKKAQALEPLSPVISINVATILSSQGQHTTAIQQCHKVLELDPQFAPALNCLGRILSMNQQYAEAIPVLRQVRSITGDSAYGLAELGYALARAGQREEALRILAQLQEFQQKGFEVQENLALVYLGLGDKERCLDSLEKVVAELGVSLFEFLDYDKRLDPIHSEPRFIQMQQQWQRQRR
jgi:serine/threonine-protein kinase